MNRTEHHGLPQWEEQDRILRTDFNAANAAVDAALHALDTDTAALQADTWKKEQTLAAATRLLYGLAAGAAPDAAFVKLAAVLPWTLVKEYRAAGAYTWTAPDLFGGRSYRVGVYMVGGGGSGGAARGSSTVTGGAAGYAKNLTLTVTPGQNIPVVVGAGGAAAIVNASTAGAGALAGKTGGTTSFNGVTVFGGEGGKTGSDTYGADGASGGQGSDAGHYRSNGTRVLYGGMAASCGTVGSQFRQCGNSQPARESQNRFDPGMVTLCAGGFCGSSLGAETITAMPDGTKGGSGAQINASADSVTGESATGCGNGGGAALNVNSSAKGAVASGAGSPGMVLIYAKAV